MSYKMDTIIGMLDEILMRLDRIERLIDFSDEDAPEDIQEAFDKVFGQKPGKPKLTIVKDDKPNNIIEFSPNE